MSADVIVVSLTRKNFLFQTLSSARFNSLTLPSQKSDPDIPSLLHAELGMSQKEEQL